MEETDTRTVRERMGGVVRRVAGLRRNYVVMMGLFLVVAATGIMFFLQYRYFMDDMGRTWEFFAGRPLVFWYNAYLVLLVLVFLTGVTRRPAIAIGIVLSVVIVLGYVHVAKFQVRGYPLLPEDLLLVSEAEAMSKMVDMGGVVATVVAVVATIGASVGANILIGRRFDLKEGRSEGAWWKRLEVVPRLVLVVTAMALLLVGTDFVRNNGGQQKAKVPWLDTEFVAWNQTQNYDANGFVLGFLYNLQKYELRAPEGYSGEAMREIRAKYEALAEAGNALRTELDANLVIALGESFMDPATIEEYYPHTGGDVTPELHKIQEEYPSGYMYSVDYGGGTANIEFEVLTGLSNYWANTVPYTTLIPKVGRIPTVASFVKGLGYGTTAVHPFNGSMYKRNIVFRAFDIERFVTEKELGPLETEGNRDYASDYQAYDKALEVLGEEGKQLVIVSTMQNHTPYPDWAFDDGERPFQVSGEWPVEESRRGEMEVYYRLLHASDRYLGDFVRGVGELEERTVVLWFGDHFPGIVPELHDSGERALETLVQETPYFIYSNFDMGEAVELPTTTPNCLVNTVFNLMGVQKSALYYLLDEVCEEVPVLTHRWLGEEGYAKSEAMVDYEMVSYDLLGGGKYWAEGVQ